MVLNKFFKPKSIAIYGVSQNPEKIASIIFYNLISSGFEGKLFPINPKYEKISSYKCYKKADSIKEDVDLAIMAIPGELVITVLEDCHKKGINRLLIISAGFAEAGEEGKVLEEKMHFLAEKYNISILGPNSLGIIIPGNNMNASFAASDAEEGGIALISQSGAICTAFLDKSNAIGIGFSHMLSIGNKTMINENDFLDYLLKDESVRVIGGYIEDFRNGRKFISMKDDLDIEKPIVIMSPGETEAAKDAIKSHTGSLASSHNIIKTALSKHGIIMPSELNQMFDLLIGFEWINRFPKGNKVAILTNAGGVGILTTEALVKSGLELAKLQKDTINALRKFLPAEAHARNPIDIIGDAKADRYSKALEILADAEEVDSIMVLLTPQLVTEVEDTAKVLNTAVKSIDKPVVPVFLGGEYVESGIKRLHDNKVLCYSDLDAAVYVLDKITEYAAYLKVKERSDLKIESESDLKKYTNNELSALPEEEVQSLINEFNIDTPKTIIVHSVKEALISAQKIGFPLVIKALTEDVIHKTDIKAIYLNIKDSDELEKKALKLEKELMELTKKNHVSFILQEQIKADLELFIGMKRNDNFGNVLLFGTGGIYTEVYKDIAQVLLPASEKEFEALINSTLVSKIIDGFRGQPKLAKDKLIETMKLIQKMVLTYPEISEVDINPAMLTEDRCILADIKVFTKNIS